LRSASPGASAAGSILREIPERSFASEFGSDAWQPKQREMIPSFGQSLINDAELPRKVQLPPHHSG